MRKTIITTLLILLLMITPVLAANFQKGSVIATQSEVREQNENEEQNEYTLSTGKEIIVNISQVQAQERIRERLNLYQCDCSDAEVVEVIFSGERRAAYHIDINQEGKILWLFEKKIQIQTYVDVETGEVINVKKPWYAWFVRFGD